MSLPASFNAIKRKIAIFIICGCLVMMTACSPLDKIISVFKDDGSGYVFKISIASDPKTLDPQLASDPSSVAVARNMFVGLLKTLPDGSLAPAAAKDYTISSDGLVYTFTIDSRYKWRAAGGYTADLTARDFVFGFQRLFDPLTGSPHAKDYFCINNAQLVNSGELEPHEIGVRAVDDETLEITLEYPNAAFLSLLTCLPASPCNQEFFESCGGKYGLEAEAIASNGPFYARFWLHDPYGKDNYVRLRRNDDYSAVTRVYPSGVNFLVEKNDSVRLTDFAAGTTNVLLTDSPLDSEEDINCERIYTACAGLVINPENEILSKKEVREIISLCLDPAELGEDVPDYLSPAGGIIPKNAYIGSTAFRSACAEPDIEKNSQLAQYRWSFVLSVGEKSEIAGTNIMVPQSFAGYKYVSSVCESLKEIIGLSLNLEIVNDSDYIRRLNGGNYDICLAIFSSDSASAFDYIAEFDGRYKGIYNESAVKAISSSDKYSTLTSAIRSCSQAESSVISEYQFIPIWYVPKFMYSSEDSWDFEYDPFSGSILFENAKSK